ncbi:general RNA polymerase II transcription factor [Boothiomyces macroporosus]|uniref:General RNA polymerase II transcription factor n=1 Tax=Boothiomyces macroporosus TaxID=261099 RepID=A0AAD5UF35_9FUNG|nr:general RNA polymerase II transcription factor [Boothiomyces macroporosus]
MEGEDEQQTVRTVRSFLTSNAVVTVGSPPEYDEVAGDLSNGPGILNTSADCERNSIDQTSTPNDTLGRVSTGSPRMGITLFLKNGVNFQQNESPVLLNVPIKWSRDEIENVVKMMFEELNVPALYLLDQPLASLYGIGVVTGVVIDIGHTSTDITPVIDNVILHAAQKSIPVGGKDIDDVLKRQFKKPQSFITELKERSCVVMTKDPIQPVTLTVQNESVTIGDLRYKCCEVLFYPYLIGKNCMGIHEALKLVINSTSEPSRRVALWESIVLCGGTSNLQGLKERFEYETSKLIASSETSNEYQPKEIKWLKIPEYMTMYKERPADVTFLGGAIVSKVLFINPS